MYGIHKKTMSAKIFILVAQIIYIIIDYLFVFPKLTNFVSINMQILIAIIFIRLNCMMFIWLPRGISWKEALGNSSAFALYYLIFQILAIWGSTRLIWSGWILFILGSLVNSISELLRKPFKDNPDNKGKLYTGGLFKYAVHINYFGDVLWVLGFALVTGNLWSLLIPLMLLCTFIFSYIPTADKYLEGHYGQAFIDYKQKTKSLIPFIW
ncbi:methyltransferase family protein [Companilactobacillus heilongjiangensis]|uniref:Uncharacterized protein n=2 Tax=Companilactobacillus heilongjiangensis TaxID=1074467 RepID=A0A0K2LEE8_9LACO|nr:DUF1295 domain-containing protein [Companilactobacillus heilongjiangensis]ALB29679.1 hypothetical protein JP39_10120 [Companilactobacillus heilongjiangensis]